MRSGRQDERITCGGGGVRQVTACMPVGLQTDRQACSKFTVNFKSPAPHTLSPSIHRCNAVMGRVAAWQCTSVDRRAALMHAFQVTGPVCTADRKLAVNQIQNGTIRCSCQVSCMQAMSC